MLDSLTTAAASLGELHTRLTDNSALALTFYESVSASQRELGRMRGALALFMAEAEPPASGDPPDNVIGFAQNVAHAIDGLERVLADAAKATLALAAARREFAAQVQSWNDAVTTQQELAKAPAPQS